jgi:sensor domain CHASE-containing protein/two-component sensor histidine kinase
MFFCGVNKTGAQYIIFTTVIVLLYCIFESKWLRLLKLRRKTLLLIGMTSIIIIVLLQVTSQRILLDSFATLETADTQRNVERVLSALSDDMSNLASNAHDWGAWDDTYTFIQDKNEEYIELNLADNTFTSLKLNVILFIDASGQFIFGRCYDLETEEFTSISECLLQQFTPDCDMLQHPDPDSVITGILLLPENPLLFASHPILTSKNEGPILGTIIMGYYINSNVIDELEVTTHLSIKIERLDSSELPADFQKSVASISDENTIYVNPLDQHSIAGYTIIHDINGEHSLALRVDLPRNIYEKGKDTINYFMLLLLSTSLAFTGVIMLLLETTVLSRLAQLNTGINYIKSNGNLSNRVSVKGNDELTNLADEINGMLTTLNISQNKIQVTNEKLHVIGSLTRHDVRNKLAVIANNVYLAKMKANPETQEYLKSIELTIDQVGKIFAFARNYEMLGVEKLDYIDVKKSIQEAVMILEVNTVKILNECGGLTVLADSLLQQLFYNLIDNSLKHGEKVTKIRVYYETQGNELRIIYEDNGVGMPDNEKELNFKEGYGKGTGYGLYLIRRICETYGWAIKETGRSGEGIKFVITIPKMNKNQKLSYYIA